MSKIKIEKWYESLIKCPSQIFGDFKFKEEHYCIYLRWRWSGSWKAYVIKCNEDGEFTQPLHDWITLNLDKDYTHDQWKEAKENALKKANERFYPKLVRLGDLWWHKVIIILGIIATVLIVYSSWK